MSEIKPLIRITEDTSYRVRYRFWEVGETNLKYITGIGSAMLQKNQELRHFVDSNVQALGLETGRWYLYGAFITWELFRLQYESAGLNIPIVTKPTLEAYIEEFNRDEKYGRSILSNIYDENPLISESLRRPREFTWEELMVNGVVGVYGPLRKQWIADQMNVLLAKKENKPQNTI